MKKNITLELHNLTTGYRIRSEYKTVGKDLTASLLAGELTCLLGANGSGKSTLLRTLSAFLPPVSGKILLDGNSLLNYNERELARKLGVVLTERCNVRHMTVKELVGLGRSPYTGFWGTLDRNDHIIVDKAIDMVGIADLSNRMIHTLSDGERQKVMIAKVLAQETPIVFLDEPTAFLDFPSKVEMMQLLHRLAHEMQMTIFLSTHDLELALQLADKIWLLDKNKGLQTGTPEDLALEGYLSDFFYNEGVVFDQMSGLFRISGRFRHHIYFVGEGARLAMAVKAFARNGIGPAQRPEHNIPVVEVTQTSFVLKVSNKESKVGSIELLLDAYTDFLKER